VTRRYPGFILCGLLIAAPAWSGARRPYGGTLSIPLTDSVRTTDPVRVVTGSELDLARQVHETLFSLSPDGGVEPVLAQEVPLPAAGGQEWVVELRSDAVFQDGSPVTSGDLLASWERLLRSDTRSPHWWLLAPVDGAVEYRLGKSTRVRGLEVINRYSLRIRLAYPCPAFLQMLTALPTAPVPSGWIRGKTAGPHPPGAGAFAWAAAPGASWVLSPNLVHPRGRPFLEKVEFKPFPSWKAAALAYELGEVQLSFQPPTSRAPVSRTVEGPASWMVFLVLNSTRVRQAPPGFQQAVQRAIDRQSLADFLPWGPALATDEKVSGSAAAVPHASVAEARPYFQQLAAQHMGIPPVHVFLVRQGQPWERAIAERLQLHLLDAGAAVSVMELDEAAFERRVEEGQYDFFLDRPLPLVSSPELQLIGLVARLGSGAALSDLFRDLRLLPVGENRSALVREKSRTTQLLLPVIPLLKHDRRVFVGENLRGMVLPEAGAINLAEAWLVP